MVDFLQSVLACDKIFIKFLKKESEI